MAHFVVTPRAILPYKHHKPRKTRNFPAVNVTSPNARLPNSPLVAATAAVFSEPSSSSLPSAPALCLAPALTQRSALTQALQALQAPPPAVSEPQPITFKAWSLTELAERMRNLDDACQLKPRVENLAVMAAMHLEILHHLPLSAAFPEFDVLRTPRAFVQKPHAWTDLLQVHGKPPWLSQLLLDETKQAESNARFAQDNRLRALARYLLCLRLLRRNRATAERLSVVLPGLLALPSVEVRHRLLMKLAGTSVDAPLCELALRSWKEAAGGEGKALALAVALVSPALAANPGTRALLESRAVANNGVVARRVLGFLLHADFGKEADVGVKVLSWPKDDNLLRMLRLGIEASEAVQRAATALNAEGGCDDGATKASWHQGRATDVQHHQVLMALLADRRARHVASRADGCLLALEAKRLRGAFRQLDQRPGMQPTARAGEELCAALLADDASHQVAAATRDAAVKTLNRLRSAARAHKKTPLSEWTLELLAQMEGCLRAWVALRHALVMQAPAESPKAAPQASFFANKAVRTYMNQTIVPLMLALQQHAPLLNTFARSGNAVDLDAISRPSDVVAQCAPWFRGDNAGLVLEQFMRQIKRPENIVAYAAQSSSWTQDYRARGLPVLERLVRASLDGTYARLRGDSPQMRALRQNPVHHGALTLWEAGYSRALPIDWGAGGWRIFDTDDLGETLDAMQQIASCQSPTHGWASHNVGNLGRLIDGSKRLIILRDAQDKVRGRAITRLMQDPGGQPVLTLSSLFVTHQNTAARHALCACAAQRAASLGFEAVYTGGEFFADAHFAAHFEADYHKALTAVSAELPDYYDELGGLVVGDAKLLPGGRPMWRLRTSL